MDQSACIERRGLAVFVLSLFSGLCMMGGGDWEGPSIGHIITVLSVEAKGCSRDDPGGSTRFRCEPCSLKGTPLALMKQCECASPYAASGPHGRSCHSAFTDGNYGTDLYLSGNGLR